MCGEMILVVYQILSLTCNSGIRREKKVSDKSVLLCKIISSYPIWSACPYSLALSEIFVNLLFENNLTRAFFGSGKSMRGNKKTNFTNLLRPLTF
jgi:hypothetical protein